MNDANDAMLMRAINDHVGDVTEAMVERAAKALAMREEAHGNVKRSGANLDAERRRVARLAIEAALAARSVDAGDANDA